MAAYHPAIVVSAPIQERAAFPSERLEEAPPTQRIGAFDLAFALATMERTAEEREAIDDAMVRAQAWMRACSAGAGRDSEDPHASFDDEPTIELPPPPIPADVPSPLGADIDLDIDLHWDNEIVTTAVDARSEVRLIVAAVPLD